MLDKIIKYSIHNKLVIGLFTLALVLWGGYSLSRISIDAVPDITNNQVQIITTSPSLAASEVERLVTFPVEIAMATIPGIEEVRSFSRFGLSVVTIVFNDDVDIYWARQQVSERLADVKSRVPAGAGEPGMAPVTTGLGEIYQYVIGTEPGYEGTYDATELRTIHDWIVRRQLLGTPGVADVSSIGGFLKQYEIAVDPDRIRSMNVTIDDIFRALAENNENTGGAYIEKNYSAYFIRSEGLAGSLDDIRRIRIRNNENGIPVLIKDVAEVRYGHAVRYGATTRNGEGEVVSAIVMMLKGENSAEVIGSVKQKMEQIRKTLPEGVTIEPFLDRTKLVNTAIGTVTKNLTEGALIVILVLLLLLGNLRAGLIVASVIPLALMFAFAMMNIFGVSGNLMSLGAIDFGLIVDGAVIIVEATLHHLLLKPGRRLTQNEMDHEVHRSASRIRKSAAFGEIIILIVYLPILALVGTEGKMFRPMAQTVSFAILGAFILSLTYVPMMTSLFLSKKISAKTTISDRIMNGVNKLYQPLIRWAMRRRAVVVTFALGLFAVSMWIFSRLGGEFIPTLEEGDLAVQLRVMTGSSLENTIRATTQAEKILLEKFPEVTQVVAKIGSGEIPTDPMPIEAADMMVILKEKDEWISARNREELAGRMAKELSVIPGVELSFQQPIQMRFNELMTGVRQDIAVKIYGEDLEKLSQYATSVGALVSQVEGAEDIYVEELTGVAQIVVEYRRDQLAKYGLTVSGVNRVLQAAFAGASAGLIYENERRFDLVVRLQKSDRSDIESVRNLYVGGKNGMQIPLHQVADVRLEDGPYQIYRDDTHRRILVAFNVRNRDIESVVNELKKKINEGIEFEPGYSVRFGGQFENLVEARQRLAVAVPLALLLIFVLLYFTFHSLWQGLLIFTAIPLSAIGGIFALWLRDMPFSISAGVGFIALFGVAVLNGIVLIAEFNHLKKESVTDVFERIYRGTRTRLRPVILTASVASMGFLPMAFSQSGGSEVQRPLATVVIGGLISATFLTLIVLPVLYYFLERIRFNRRATSLLLFALVMGGTHRATAQEMTTTYSSVQQAMDTAAANNPRLRAADLRTQREDALSRAGWDVPKTGVSLLHGQYNSVYDNDNQINITQSFVFPTVYANQRRLAQARTAASEWMREANRNELMREVKAAWYELWMHKNKRVLLLEQDSLYQRFVRAAALRFETGETNLLEKATAESQAAEIKAMLEQNQGDIDIMRVRLQVLLNTRVLVDMADGALQKREWTAPPGSQEINENPGVYWARQQIEIADRETALQRSKMLPEFNIGYFNQSLNGWSQDRSGNPVYFGPRDRFTGFQAGIALPIFGARSGLASVNAAEKSRLENEALLESAINDLAGQFRALLKQQRQLLASLAFYENSALPQARLILEQAQRGFESGNIGYIEYMQGLVRALSIRTRYIEILNDYNQVTIQMEFISGKP